MTGLLNKVQVQINPQIYLKDPFSSDIGKSIISEGIKFIYEFGFEEFTFKKLAIKVQTTESTLYRYFNNKHRFLLYLMSWYWGILEYMLVFSTANVTNTEAKLTAAICVLVEDFEDFNLYDIINLKMLNRIAVSESVKAYLTNEVEIENRNGFYSSYLNLCNRISILCTDINPEYKYSNSLVSTIYEGIHHQKYFSLHIPTLTDFKFGSNIEMTTFFVKLALDNLKH